MICGNEFCLLIEDIYFTNQWYINAHFHAAKIRAALWARLTAKQLDSSSFTKHPSPATLDKLYNTAAMSRLFSNCTSAIMFVLLGLAACITLATTAPTAQSVQVRQATASVIHLNNGVCYSVSYCRPCLCSRLLAELILTMVNTGSPLEKNKQTKNDCSMLCCVPIDLYTYIFCDLARVTSVKFS